MRLLITPLFIAVFLSSNVYCQTIEGILKEYEEQLNKTYNFQADITYTLFEGNTGNKVLEKLNGISAKYNQSYYSKIGPTEFIFNKKYSLKISHAEKVMVISDPAFRNDLLSLNVSSILLNQFTSEGVKDNGAFWECTFLPKNNTAIPYSKYVIHISKTNYQLLKQILFFSTPIKHKDKNKEQYVKNQRLEIKFKNQSNKVFSEDKFLLNTYTSLFNSEYKPKPIIGDYEIINTLTNTLTIN